MGSVGESPIFFRIPRENLVGGILFDTERVGMGSACSECCLALQRAALVADTEMLCSSSSNDVAEKDTMGNSAAVKRGVVDGGRE